MKTIIISANQKQANFIRKGLAYENMSSAMISVQAPDAEMEKALIENDGVFIFFDNEVMASGIIRKANEVKPGMPVIILSLMFERFFEGLRDSKKIVDFYIRPYPFRQMVSEMKFAIFSIKEKMDVYRYVLRNLELDISSHMVKVGNDFIYLRNKEFSLLHYLMLNRGKVLSRNEILENVWDRNADMMTNTVDVHISKLRKKIECGGENKFIRTVHCLGYVLE
jgi:DNA-binding response OmpR family regulator